MSHVTAQNFHGFVIFSMIITLISLILNCRYLFIGSRFNHEYKAQYQCKFTLECPDISIESKYSYTNNKIQESIENSLHGCKDSSSWKKYDDDGDVSYNIEVYWIKCEMGCMDVYFDLTLGYNYNRKQHGDDISSLLFHHISNMMTKENSGEHDRFKKSLIKKFNLSANCNFSIVAFECLNSAQVEQSFTHNSGSGSGSSSGGGSDVDSRLEAHQFGVPVARQEPKAISSVNGVSPTGGTADNSDTESTDSKYQD